MTAVIGVLLGLALASALPGAAAGAPEILVDGIPHVRNGSTPSGGRQTMDLEEIWRAGGDDESVLFGVIIQVLEGPDGNIYLLDRQLSQVYVYGPAGQFLGTRSREGEGPGEVRGPIDMAFLEDGRLALMQGFPGKVVTLDTGGNPAGSFPPAQSDPSQGGYCFMRDLRCRGGSLACTGMALNRNGDAFERVDFLSLLNPDGSERVRILEVPGADMVVTARWVERDEYRVQGGLWALGPDGRIYTAPQRDRYRLDIYSPSGELERVIERDYSPRKRTKEEKENAGQVRIVANGREVDIEHFPEDHAPCIQSIYVTSSGEIWVLNGHGGHGEDQGTLCTYDVFDPDGSYVRQIALQAPGDLEEDRVFPLGPDRFVVVQGYQGARRASMAGTGGGGDEPAEEDAAALTVICYQAEAGS